MATKLDKNNTAHKMIYAFTAGKQMHDKRFEDAGKLKMVDIGVIVRAASDELNEFRCKAIALELYQFLKNLFEPSFHARNMTDKKAVESISKIMQENNGKNTLADLAIHVDGLLKFSWELTPANPQ
jgi:hypothetical protein